MASSPLGRPTRGTTGTNRLRRNDRWIAASEALRTASDPLVVDLGYGASGVTAFELAARLRRVRADAEVRGLEID
ncbi:MAG TPA: class I SAM-dependent methyltransferase, partial [Microbacterium sp.]|nr:class I SAM-dependent methyltransferase [Microbacterium sp.]